MPRAVSPTPALRRARLGEGNAGCLLGARVYLVPAGAVGVAGGGWVWWTVVLVCVAVHDSVLLGKSAAGPCKCDAHLHSFL